MKRLLPLLALALAAGSAGAGVIMQRTWVVRDETSLKEGWPSTIARVGNHDEKVEISLYGLVGLATRRLTRQEAAELGRALLEAAGEKAGDASACKHASPASPDAIDYGPLKGCRPVPCPKGWAGCLVNHLDCGEAKP